MLIVHVHIQVKPDHAEVFKAASVKNATKQRARAGHRCALTCYSRTTIPPGSCWWRSIAHRTPPGAQANAAL